MIKEQPTTHSAVRFLRDHYVELLAVLTLLFVVQTGLVPFDFGSRSGGGHGSLFSVKATHLTLPDVVSNIFLYFPLGMFVHWSLYRTATSKLAMPGGGRWVFLATVAITAGVSGCIELLQAYSPSRVSSAFDLVSNILGASLGAMVSTIARRIVPQLMRTAWVEFHERPLPAILKTYCVGLVVLGAVPFSFSLDRVRLKESIRAVNLIPFASPADTNVETSKRQNVETLNVVESDHLRWQRMKRWSRWTAECASFGVLAWLLVLVLRSHYEFGRWGTFMLIGWIGTGFAVALSIMQLPIVSRVCDVTDILFRVLGLGLGCLCLAWYRRRTAVLSTRRLASSKLALPVVHREFAAFACVAVAIYILYVGLIPMRFSVDLDGPAKSLSSGGFLPFFAYFFARFDIMMGDVLEKLLTYVLFAATLSACWTPVRLRNAAPHLMTVAVLCFVISVCIEIAQMFIDVRVTSLTDPILAVVGAVLGVLGQQNAAMFYQFATARDAAVAPAARETALSPTDILVGSLIDQQAGFDGQQADFASQQTDAPVEVVPTPGLQRTHD